MRGRQFNHYLWAVDKKTLTEDHIIGTAIAVHRREIVSEACGVQVWCTSSWHWEQWLLEKLQELRRLAEERGGVSVGLLLDKDGLEVTSFGTSLAMFSEPEQPIKEILVVLGGPRGIDAEVLQVLEKGGLHEGLMKVKLPGWLSGSWLLKPALLMLDRLRKAASNTPAWPWAIS